MPADAQISAPLEQSQQDALLTQLVQLQNEWAIISYQVTDKTSQLDALHKLEEQAAIVSAAHSNRAEPKIWEGIIWSTDAGLSSKLSAGGKVKKAKALLEASLKQDPQALDGSAHTSLGALYYQVPGWPLSFGDDKKAEKHLLQGLQISPNGIDANFFYADFLIKVKRYDEAKTYLEHALQAPDRPMRPLADSGRRLEIEEALARIQAMQE